MHRPRACWCRRVHIRIRCTCNGLWLPHVPPRRRWHRRWRCVVLVCIKRRRKRRGLGGCALLVRGCTFLGTAASRAWDCRLHRLWKIFEKNSNDKQPIPSTSQFHEHIGRHGPNQRGEPLASRQWHGVHLAHNWFKALLLEDSNTR